MLVFQFLKIFSVFVFLIILIKAKRYFLFFSRKYKQTSVIYDIFNGYSFLNETFKQKELIYNNGSIKCKVYIIEEDNEMIPYNKNIIHLAVYFGLNYAFYPLVSMTSAMMNCNLNTTILIYHYFSESYSIKEINILKTIKQKYKENIRLNFYIITNIFLSCTLWRDYSVHYLRLILPELLPTLDKILYLDGDSIIFEDLSEIYNLPMNDYYVLGFPDVAHEGLTKFGLETDKYINSGTLLLNLKNIRENNITGKTLSFLFNKLNESIMGDQDAINCGYHPKIGFLPIKYGVYLINDIKTHIKKTRLQLNYTEVFEAIKNPGILHLTQCEPKILSNETKHLYGKNYNYLCINARNLFFKFAKFTHLYAEIAKKYNYKKIND